MALDDYQQKLESFISVVPTLTSPSMINRSSNVEYYGEVLSGTPVLPRVKSTDLAEYAKKVDGANIIDNVAFTTLTGLTHRGLLGNWKIGGLLTSCNGFVGKAGMAMGATGLGGFDIEKMLQGINKSHCWITPSSGLLPRYGDVFETRSHTPGHDYLNIHVGISLNFEGNKWYTIEGGQGGPAAGVDKVARCVKPFHVEHLLGWIDMKQYVSNAPPIPDWLLGSWMIYAGNVNYIYRFNRYGDVTQLAYHVHGNVIEDLLPILDYGKLTVLPGDNIQVQWERDGGLERFTYDRWNSFPALMERMNGTAADGTAMHGVRF